MSGEEEPVIPVTTVEQVATTMAPVPVTTLVEFPVTLTLTSRVEGGPEGGQSGGEEERWEEKFFWMEVVQAKTSQELQEALMDIPHLVAQVVQNELRLHPPGPPAGPPAGRPAQVPVPAQVMVLAPIPVLGPGAPPAPAPILLGLECPKELL
ncbi:UNVERIFIED_CONTAM: hypothetical protein K2H54_048742 [Gekko kuhli]